MPTTPCAAQGPKQLTWNNLCFFLFFFFDIHKCEKQLKYDSKVCAWKANLIKAQRIGQHVRVCRNSRIEIRSFNLLLRWAFWRLVFKVESGSFSAKRSIKRSLGLVAKQNRERKNQRRDSQKPAWHRIQPERTRVTRHFNLNVDRRHSRRWIRSIVGSTCLSEHRWHGLIGAWLREQPAEVSSCQKTKEKKEKASDYN